MDLQAVKDMLECAGKQEVPPFSDDSAEGFYDLYVSHGIRVDVIEPGRVVCLSQVPHRLLSTAIATVGAPITGRNMEINLSYLDSAFLGEEVKVEAMVLRVGKTIGVVSLELRKKRNGKTVALGRQTKYLTASSKL